MATAPILTVTLNPAIDLGLAIERWPQGDMARAAGVSRAAGGKGINVSRVLTELGTASEAFCVLGRGPDSAVFLSLLAGAKFSVTPHEIAGTVRTNVTVTCADGDRLKVNQPGPQVDAAAWRGIERTVRTLLPGRRWIALSGALPPGAPADGYARLARLARRAGVAVALDCDGPSLLAALDEKVDLIKPNREELALTLGRAPRGRRGVLALARELQARGVRRVTVSAGGGECLALDEAGRAWRAVPPTVENACPMGAGDALLAGMLAGLCAGKPFEAALRLGMGCGAATAAVPETELCRASAARRYARAISLEPLDR